MIRELIEAGVNKLNVSLNANSKEKYNQICKPKYADAYKNVIKFIKMSKAAGLEIQVTAVTIPEIEINQVKKLVEQMGVKFSLRRYVGFFW